MRLVRLGVEFNFRVVLSETGEFVFAWLYIPGEIDMRCGFIFDFTVERNGAPPNRTNSENRRTRSVKIQKKRPVLMDRPFLLLDW